MEDNKNVLFLIRGISGAGKSTVAEILANKYGYDEGYPICTADDYFMKDGKYMFDASKLGIAHKICQTKCEKACAEGIKKVFVANTLTTQKELNEYYKIAKKYDYMVVSLIVENRHGGTNTHNIPEYALERMEKRFNIKLK